VIPLLSRRRADALWATTWPVASRGRKSLHPRGDVNRLTEVILSPLIEGNCEARALVNANFPPFYPATIGSEEKPAPSGDFKVKGVSWNPKYEYDPKFAWKGVNTKRKLSIGPGPNN
jgi:hypothetical protein